MYFCVSGLSFSDVFIRAKRSEELLKDWNVHMDLRSHLYGYIKAMSCVVQGRSYSVVLWVKD